MAMVMSIQSDNLTTLFRMEENDNRKCFTINFHESMGPGWGSNAQPLDQQSDSLPIALQGQSKKQTNIKILNNPTAL